MQTINATGCFGKYPNTAVEYFHGMTLDGCHDEETGDVETFGWYALITFDDEPVLVQWDDGSEVVRGVIVHEDSQGFVDAEFFDCATEACKRFELIEAEYAELCEE